MARIRIVYFAIRSSDGTARRNATATDSPFASIPFADGVVRPVFLDADGRQYVLDDNGQPIYGVWIYIDEPQIVATS